MLFLHFLTNYHFHYQQVFMKSFYTLNKFLVTNFYFQEIFENNNLSYIYRTIPIFYGKLSNVSRIKTSSIRDGNTGCSFRLSADRLVVIAFQNLFRFSQRKRQAPFNMGLKYGIDS